VAAVPTQTKSVTPTSTAQNIIPDSGKFLSKVTVNGDSNLAAGNIKNGVSIFGVNGTYVGSSGGDTGMEDSLVMRMIPTYTNDRVTTIGSYAFYCCADLTSVSFPNAITIGDSAFYSCANLASVSFPNATTIGSYAFFSCTSLTSASFSCATAIGSFAFTNCAFLSAIYLMNSSICTLADSNIFSKTSIWSDKGSIFVPSSLVTSYKTATNWVFFSNRIYGA
jgi:hypothetical protein